MPTPASTGAAASTAPAFWRLALHVVVVSVVSVVIGGVIVVIVVIGVSVVIVCGSTVTRAPWLFCCFLLLLALSRGSMATRAPWLQFSDR